MSIASLRRATCILATLAVLLCGPVVVHEYDTSSLQAQSSRVHAVAESPTIVSRHH